MSDDPRVAESWQQSEFGLGEGMIDPVMRREGRSALPGHQEMWEIKSRPKTFGGSELGLPGGVRPDVEETPVPRLLPGETEADRA
jgi:hypothetical protein